MHIEHGFVTNVGIIDGNASIMARAQAKTKGQEKEIDQQPPHVQLSSFSAFLPFPRPNAIREVLKTRSSRLMVEKTRFSQRLFVMLS